MKLILTALRFVCLISAFLFGVTAARAVEPEGQTRFVRINLTVTNPAPIPKDGAQVWIYLPVTTTGNQRLKRVEVKDPHQVSSDALGNTIVQFDLGTMPPFSTRILQMSAQTMMFSDAHAAEDLKAEEHYLGAERFVDADAPEVMDLARNLRRDNSRQTVEAIYDWVKGNVHYEGFTAADFGARHVLRQRSGDCTEYAYLVAALARANGLPARVLGGYVSDHDFIPRPGDYHNWAEVHFDGTWHLVDAQKGNLFRNAENYVAFRIVSAKIRNALGDVHRFKSSDGLIVRFNN